MWEIYVMLKKLNVATTKNICFLLLSTFLVLNPEFLLAEEYLIDHVRYEQSTLQTALVFIEGTFGALFMVICGLLAIISAPICILVAIIRATSKKDYTAASYIKLALIPIFFLGMSILIFILRALIATIFAG
jgi:hypothetical protein